MISARGNDEGIDEGSINGQMVSGCGWLELLLWKVDCQDGTSPRVGVWGLVNELGFNDLLISYHEVFIISPSF